MKLLRYIGIHCILGVLLMAGFSACQDEALVTVTRICTQKVGDTETELAQVRLGEMIRIEGNGFATTKAIYVTACPFRGLTAILLPILKSSSRFRNQYP